MAALTNADTTVLITGANRGLGNALVAKYLLRPNHTVVACVRTLTTADSISSLPKDSSSTLVIERIDSANHSTPAAAAVSLLTKGINVLDVVVANAGISKVHPLAAEADLDDLREHYEVNVIGQLALFQATLPLLRRAVSEGRKAKFVGMSSSAASIGGMDLRPVPNSVYGPSKAALNYIVRKIHFENEDLIALVVDPGWVKTDMGNEAAGHFGLEEAEIEIEASITGVIAVIDAANRETHSGKFHYYSGGDYPW